MPKGARRADTHYASLSCSACQETKYSGSVQIWDVGPGLATARPSRPALRERRPYSRIRTLPTQQSGFRSLEQVGRR
jgi:type II secretory ATPase GspE/PulE/Tfp pilus assembly ATPase PilB-like protein